MKTENFYLAGGEHCNCSVPCDVISYQPILSYAYFPSTEFAPEFHTEMVKKHGARMVIDAENISKYNRENLLELNVYFQDLIHLHIEQQPAYEGFSAFGEIGGQLGLCIGASLLTLVEFCDVIITIIKIRLGRTVYTVNS
ncbi:hypothetical protein OS493_026898 [Desmophyllum pertusum]|uniref:Uncharacterized protein n=1 Tax=Desmophyllum pertusum TaxID=174260 RepID=A0A9W9Z9X8_9CNID|nr:hypothetical protein OS493_026898 [Desmophyllum pertusum]